MSRVGDGEGRRAEAAIAVEAGRRLIARGVRPTYSVLASPVDGGALVRIREIPGLTILAGEWDRIADMARDRIADELEVDRDAFDVVLEG